MQLWVVHHLLSQTPFDIWDLMMSEMEDTLQKASRETVSCPMFIGFASSSDLHLSCLQILVLR
jgi:hypothetical protein